MRWVFAGQPDGQQLTSLHVLKYALAEGAGSLLWPESSAQAAPAVSPRVDM